MLGEAELAMEKTPESAWLAGESLLFVSRGDSEDRLDLSFTDIRQLAVSLIYLGHLAQS